MGVIAPHGSMRLSLAIRPHLMQAEVVYHMSVTPPLDHPRTAPSGRKSTGENESREEEKRHKWWPLCYACNT